MAYRKKLSWEKQTFPYNETLSRDGYFYEISIHWENRPAEVIVAPDSVAVYFLDGSCVHTNLCPHSMFQDEPRLKRQHLQRVLSVLASTGMEGRSYSKEEMLALYRHFKGY